MPYLKKIITNNLNELDKSYKKIINDIFLNSKPNKERFIYIVKKELKIKK